MEAAATRNSNILQTYPTGDLTGAASRKDTMPIGGPTNSLIPVGGISENDTSTSSPAGSWTSWARWSTRARAARADYAATRFDIEAARASLVANVADSYFQARGAAIQLDDANESVRIERELLRRRPDQGRPRPRARTSDADRIAGDLAQAKSAGRRIWRRNCTSTSALLLILVGRGPSRWRACRWPPTCPIRRRCRRRCRATCWQRRPDVREAD